MQAAVASRGILKKGATFVPAGDVMETVPVELEDIEASVWHRFIGIVFSRSKGFSLYQ